MIYFTGDTHGGIDMKKFTTKNLRLNHIELTEHDYIIILGDFGFPFLPSDIVKNSPTNGEYRFWCNFIQKLPCMVCFIDGNHDNHDFWKNQIAQKWHGGKIHKHPDINNCIHLMRGEIYEIENHSIFAFGGAASTDVKPQYDEYGNCIWKGRKEGRNWWRSEVASEDEIINAFNNLSRLSHNIDCIVTHTPPQSIVREIIDRPDLITDKTAMFLDTVMSQNTYKTWVTGHLHKEWSRSDIRMTGIYNNIKSYDELIDY